MPVLLNQSQKFVSSAALILSVLAIFLAVAMQSTPCANAASGSCAVGDLETFSSAITVNEDGNDADTRVEGDTDANLIYVDAGNDRVGIGTNTPASLLDVDGLLTASTANISGGTITGITDLVVADGGTGVSSLTDHGVMLGSGAGAVSVTAAGSAGEVLTSNGAGSDPTYQTSDSTASGQYTGDGSDPQAITGIGFQPTWIIVFRDDGALGHWGNVQSVADSEVYQFASTAETDLLDSFGADGFSVQSTWNTNLSVYRFTVGK